MATYKLTTLFSATTAISTPNAPLHRTAGWSESIYGNFASVQALLAEAGRIGPAAGLVAPSGAPLGYWPARAGLLGVGSSISGYRIQQVDVPGPVQTGFLNYGGTVGILQDIPQMAILMRSPGLGVNNIRKWTIRGIPDQFIVEGEYAPGATYQAILQTFINSLAPWSFRAKVSPAGTVKIIGITAAGIATTEVVPTFNVNTMIRITKSRDSGGNLRSGRFMCTAVSAAPPGFTIAGWNFGLTTGGSAKFDATISYPQIDVPNTTPGRAVTRKVGRPFTQYRGRRSKRR